MKLAIYADLNLNLIDGSAIWLTSITQLFSEIPNVEVDLFLKRPIEDSVNIERLFKLKKLKIHLPKLAEGSRELDISEAIEQIALQDELKTYDAFLFRGQELCYRASLVEKFAGRIWTYFTDIPIDSKKLTPEKFEKLNLIISKSKYILVQTEKFKKYLVGILPLAKKKVRDLPPMVPAIVNSKLRFEKNSNEKFKIIYSGQFKREYASLEMFRIFKNLYEDCSAAELNIYGKKIHALPNDLLFEKSVMKELVSAKGVIWHQAVERKVVLDALPQMDVGWAWRHDSLELNTLEISTKLLEYSAFGVPSIMARSEINEKVFGKDYPLFANSEEEALAKLRLVARDRELLIKLSKQVMEIARPYQFSEIKKNKLEPLIPHGARSLPNQNLLIAGHDLRFIDPLANLFSSDFNISKDHWWGHKYHDVYHSEIKAKEADIIFCEWFLGNAEWYSKNKREGSKLVVRMHLQEVETTYPSNADIPKIDKIIIVSDHTKRDAIAKFDWGWCEDKVEVIQNAIDCTYFDRVKPLEAKITLGVVGITPMRKRLDLALDILKKCRQKNKKFHLNIKGKMPTDYAWLRARPDEMLYFETQLNRIEHDPDIAGFVHFEDYGDDMGSWYQNIGFLLSTSDFEGTHQSVAEGGASGALPVIKSWEGAAEIYDPQWVFDDTEQMAEYILTMSTSPSLRAKQNEARIYMQKNFDLSVVLKKYKDLWQAI
jgi:glycosyltransferase involved in cell wall biosynthesis